MLSTAPVAGAAGASSDNTVAAAVVHAAQETAGAFTALERQLRHTDSFNDVKEVDAGECVLWHVLVRCCCCCCAIAPGGVARWRWSWSLLGVVLALDA
jgi:hypothetical protein